MKKVFSIIVPIYNVEKYLEECIKSVLEQNFENFELILVNDGSTDNSKKICEEFQKEDKRVIIINKKNGGLSDARNAGIDASNGKYLIFLDGDDTLNENSLEYIYKEIDNGLELFICTFNKYILNKKIKHKIKVHKEVKYKNIIYSILKQMGELSWSAWSNVYKSDIVKKYNIKFRKNLIGAEDCDFFTKYVDYVKKYKIIDYSIINYRLNREGSITNSICYDSIYGQLVVFSEKFYKYEKIDTLKERKALCEYFSNKFLNTISTIGILTEKEEIDNIVKFITNNKKILKYSKGIKYSISKIIWKIKGFYEGSQILDRRKDII